MRIKREHFFSAVRRFYLKDGIPKRNMEYSGGIFLKVFRNILLKTFFFKKLIDAFDREIGSDAENAVHSIKINILDL